jgi:hypothetical protein
MGIEARGAEGATSGCDVDSLRGDPPRGLRWEQSAAGFCGRSVPRGTRRALGSVGRMASGAEVQNARLGNQDPQSVEMTWACGKLRDRSGQLPSQTERRAPAAVWAVHSAHRLADETIRCQRERIDSYVCHYRCRLRVGLKAPTSTREPIHGAGAFVAVSGPARPPRSRRHGQTAGWGDSPRRASHGGSAWDGTLGATQYAKWQLGHGQRTQASGSDSGSSSPD